MQKKIATGGGAAEVEQVNGVKLAARNLGEVPARDLKGLAEAIGKQIGSGVVALVSTADGKASIVVGVSLRSDREDQRGRSGADGVGCGRRQGRRRAAPDMAQAGGPDGSRADEALAAIRGALAS